MNYFCEKLMKVNLLFTSGTVVQFDRIGGTVYTVLFNKDINLQPSNFLPPNFLFNN